MWLDEGRRARIRVAGDGREQSGARRQRGGAGRHEQQDGRDGRDGEADAVACGDGGEGTVAIVDGSQAAVVAMEEQGAVQWQRNGERDEQEGGATQPGSAASDASVTGEHSPLIQEPPTGRKHPHP